MAKRKAEGDYAVGYGKPPKATQFRKGQSGNPKGRPKGRKNAATVLNEVLAEKVTINENGQRRKVTKLEAAFKQVVNGAITGDNKSSRLLIQILPLLNAELDEAPPAMPTAEADMQVLKGLVDRLKTTESDGGAQDNANLKEDN